MEGKGLMMWAIVAVVGLLVGYFAASAMLGGQVSAKDAQISGLQSQLTQASAAASGKDALLSQKNSAINEKDAMLKDKDAMLLSTGTKPAGLRVLLNSLYREHVDLAAAATRAGFDASPGFGAAAGALLKNSDDISAAVGSVYGTEGGDKFKQIWNSHITFFVDYTTAAKAGDKPKMDKAVQNLGGYVDAISDFLSGANPNLPREAVKTLVGEHVTLLKTAVDSHGAGNYTASYDKQREAAGQIGTIADAVAGAIVKQKPELFK